MWRQNADKDLRGHRFYCIAGKALHYQNICYLQVGAQTWLMYITFILFRSHPLQSALAMPFTCSIAVVTDSNDS